MTYIRLCLAVAILVLSGCAKDAPPVASMPDAPVQLLPALPQPEAGDVIRSTRLAFIGPFTELRVEVYGVPELQRDIMADGEGNFAFPLVGNIAAVGKTPAAVAEDIRGKLVGRYVRDPQVTVNFKPASSPLALQSMSVTVDGQVARAGSYPVAGRMTLMRAVALAGGVSEYAKLEDVVVFRSVGNKQYVGIYNLGGIRRGNYADPEIFPNDVVIVGDSPQRRQFDKLLQATPAFLSPIILLSREL